MRYQDLVLWARLEYFFTLILNNTSSVIFVLPLNTLKSTSASQTLLHAAEQRSWVMGDLGMRAPRLRVLA